jgi:hypothetical protein
VHLKCDSPKASQHLSQGFPGSRGGLVFKHDLEITALFSPGLTQRRSAISIASVTRLRSSSGRELYPLPNISSKPKPGQVSRACVPDVGVVGSADRARLSRGERLGEPLSTLVWQILTCSLKLDASFAAFCVTSLLHLE